MKHRILQRYYTILAGYARKYLRKHTPLVIGINGSVGKTSCRMIIAQTLQQYLPHKRIYTSSKNFNGELGLSLSIFCIESFTPSIRTFLITLRTMTKRLWRGEKSYEVIILEYGIDRPGEMDFILSIAKPDIGVFTAIDSVHSLQFGDPAKIANEEVKMIRATKDVAFLNAADTYAMQLKDMLEIDLFTYQTAGYEHDTHISFENDHYAIAGDSIGTEFDLKIQDMKLRIHTNIFGKPNYGYIGVALTIADILSYRWYGEPLLAQLEKQEKVSLYYQLQPGRMSIFSGVEDSILVDSTYNSSPLSMRQLINTVHQLKNHLFPERKIRLALGDMRELGDLTEQEHRLLAAYVQAVADKVFLLGDSMHAFMYDELGKIGFSMDDVSLHPHAYHLADSMQNMLSNNPDKSIILFKGSQNTIFMEEAVKKLLLDRKDHETLPRQSDRRMRQKNYYFKKKIYENNHR